MSLLFLGESPQRAREIQLAKHAPHGRNRASRPLQIDACAARIAPHILELLAEEAREELVPGETLLRERDRRGEDVGQRQRPEIGERRRQGIDDSRDRTGEGPARRNLSEASEIVGRHGCGGDALTVDDDDLSPVGNIEDEGSLAAKTEVGDLGDRGREHGRHAGVHGVAAGAEHPHAGLGREVSPGRDDGHPADHFGSVGGRGSSILGPGHADTDAEGGGRGAAGDDPV
jgi:hypothetical protein